MEEGRWVSMVTGRAPTNIAVIKYWGKRHEKLILPLNSSLSLTLDPHHMSATTTVATSPSFTSDRLWLNGKEVLISGERYQNCLREIRSRAEDVYDQIIGRLITKEEWKNLHVHIASVNNFPTAAGLASSAAGFACLVFALAQLMGVKEKYPGELSSIARMGSGSSCRSLYGGFVRWNMGKEDSGRDSVADQVADETHWKDLTVIIAVVSSREKETSSTSGMQESVHTSTLLPFRVKEVVPKRMAAMEDAIKNRDFSSFARITMADSNQFHAICLDSRPPIFYMNDASHRIISLVERWNQASKDPEVAYTFDAGPNAVMFARDRKTACLFLKQLVKSFPPASDADLASYVVGNPDIIKEACLESLESNEVPLTIGTFPSIPGQLKYIICTQQGEGPSVLPHPASALLDSTTGLPF